MTTSSSQPKIKPFSNFSPATLLGYLAIGLGLELILGWFLHNEAMVRVIASSNSVSFNTAVAFVLSGISLVLRDQPWAVLVRRVIAWTLVIGASVILYEDIYDVSIGIDWESLHRTVSDGSPRPGRVAPNTCVALLLIGLVLRQLDRATSPMRRRFVVGNCIGLVLLCASGVFGLLLDPTLMFGWYKFNRMAAPTATGVALITAGLYFAYIKRHQNPSPTGAELGSRILFTGTTLLLAMGMAGGLATVVVFANYQQKSIERQMQSDLTQHRQLLSSLISDAKTGTVLAAKDQTLTALLIRLRAHPKDEVARQQLSQRLSQVKEQDVVREELDTRDGAPPITAGDAKATSLRLDFTMPEGTALLWQENTFVLLASHEIKDLEGNVVGALTVTRKLAGLTKEYLKPHAMGASGEVVVCGTTSGTIACFPSRLHQAPNLLKVRAERAALPIDAALAGATAIRSAVDYRGVKVVAAYAPVGTTGLGIVSKVDASDLFDPINSLLIKSMIVLSLSLTLGVLILRSQIKPVIARLVDTQHAAITSERRAQRGERRLKAITDHLPALIGYIDKGGVYQFANKTYERWFGIPASQIIGKTPRDLLEPEMYAVAWPTIQAALEGEEVTFEHKTETGLPHYPEYVSVTYIPELDADGVVLGFNVLAMDVTDRHYREESLKDLAYKDSLTNLPNRRLFSDRLDQAIARSRRSHELMALMYLDIDHFKSINDSFGHDTGDLLLREFANRLRKTIRAADTVARLGGDEFTIIMESIPSKDVATAKAQKILNAIAIPFELDGKRLKVGTSIGIAIYAQEDLDAQQLMKHSDAALYTAKGAGRGKYALFESDVRQIIDSGITDKLCDINKNVGY